ncbi:MAG: hypothetical protein EHM21_03110 [Chloroflexi bacterium]|nr:MAG: hypothetical protein EHM21_03110 [Chloroflexota bacterium]
MIAELTQARLIECPPDLLLHPSLPPDLDIFLGFPRIPEAIAAGDACARQALPEINCPLEGG